MQIPFKLLYTVQMLRKPLQITVQIVGDEIYKGKILQPTLPRAVKFEPRHREHSIFLNNRTTDN